MPSEPLNVIPIHPDRDVPLSEEARDPLKHYPRYDENVENKAYQAQRIWGSLTLGWRH